MPRWLKNWKGFERRRSLIKVLTWDLPGGTEKKINCKKVRVLAGIRTEHLLNMSRALPLCQVSRQNNMAVGNKKLRSKDRRCGLLRGISEGKASRRNRTVAC
jgi:hypothetical protein